MHLPGKGKTNEIIKNKINHQTTAVVLGNGSGNECEELT